MSIFADHMLLMVTMVVGSFIAGSSAAGGGAVAFPVMTLILGASPIDARDFALCIQSVGMGAASLFILRRGIIIDQRLVLSSLGWGLMGYGVAFVWLLPLIGSRHTVLGFGVVWFVFAIALWQVNRRPVTRRAEINRNQRETGALIVLSGIIGGVLVAAFGTGADLMLFSVAVLGFELDERIGTPTSVMVMAGLSIVGAAHRFFFVGLSEITLQRWLACAPVVVVGAPFGAWFASKLPRSGVVRLLIVILVVQFIGTIVVLRPSPTETAALILVGGGGFAFFRKLSRLPAGSSRSGTTTT